MTVEDTGALNDLKLRLREFAEERDWVQFHTPKNLAMALSVEAGELLQEFLWATGAAVSTQMASQEKPDAIADEMGDVLLYLVRLADRLDIDLVEAASAKIAKNAVRYPADLVRGRSDKMPRLNGEVG